MSTLRVNTIQTNTTSGIDVNSPLETVPSLDVTGSVTVGSNISVSGIVTAGTFSGNLTGSVNLTTGITTVSAGSTASPSISPSGDNNTGIFFPSPDTIAFGEGGVEGFRLDSSGRLLVGITSADPNGGRLQLSGGITFPATAVAASNANTLDDYEEGTWTPSFSATAVTFTYDSNYRAAIYTKIGRLVQFQFYLGITALSGTTANTIKVTGLPFQSITGDNIKASCSVANLFGVDWPAAAKSFTASVTTNSTEIQLEWTQDDAGNLVVTAADIGASGYIAISGTYTVG
jgi:hypothetical protein